MSREDYFATLSVIDCEKVTLDEAYIAVGEAIKARNKAEEQARKQHSKLFNLVSLAYDQRRALVEAGATDLPEVPPIVPVRIYA